MRLLLGAVIALLPSCGLAQANPAAPLAGFLDRIGGSADPKVLDRDDELLEPLKTGRSAIVGSRFFSEKLLRDGLATAVKVRIAFEKSCVGAGGTVEPETSGAARSFANYAARQMRLPTVPAGSPYGWVGMTHLCSADREHVLAGLAVMVYDTTGVASRGDIGSRLMMRLAVVPTKTAVYLYRGDTLISTAQSEQLVEEMRAVALRMEEAKRVAAAQRAHEAARFREGLAVGVETNCGIVIERRGPVAQVAMTIRLPTIGKTDQKTFWVNVDTLYPPSGGHPGCSYTP